MGRRSSDESDDERRRKRRRRSSSSSERSRSRDIDRHNRHHRNQDHRNERRRSRSRERPTDPDHRNERRRSRSREKPLDRWPKDGYKELQRDNFRRDKQRDFQGRSNHLSEEFMAHRRSQREEICERGVPEVWGKSPPRDELESAAENDDQKDSSGEKNNDNPRQEGRPRARFRAMELERRKLRR